MNRRQFLPCAKTRVVYDAFSAKMKYDPEALENHRGFKGSTVEPVAF